MGRGDEIPGLSAGWILVGVLQGCTRTEDGQVRKKERKSTRWAWIEGGRGDELPVACTAASPVVHPPEAGGLPQVSAACVKKAARLPAQWLGGGQPARRSTRVEQRPSSFATTSTSGPTSEKECPSPPSLPSMKGYSTDSSACAWQNEQRVSWLRLDSTWRRCSSRGERQPK